jgi:hypothetical protein
MIDNKSVYHGLIAKRYANIDIDKIIGRICMLAIESNFLFWVEWVSTDKNNWADRLSRVTSKYQHEKVRKHINNKGQYTCV